MLVGIGALGLFALGGVEASGARGRCDRALPTGPAGLPAPIVVTTQCGRFRIQRNGAVVFKGSRPLPVPKGSNYFMDLTWYRFSRHHLLLGRGMQQLWRSHERYSATRPGDLGLVALGPRRLAFSYFRSARQKKPNLYVARFRGREHFVASGEQPVAFLPGGLLTWRSDLALVQRAADGRSLRLAAPHAVDPQWDRPRGKVVFRVGHELRVFDGHRVRELVNRYALGVRGAPVVELPGGLVSIHDSNRLAILDLDGHVVARTPLPERLNRNDSVSSSVVAKADGKWFAFTATHRAQGTETVYVFGAGTTRAAVRFTTKTDFGGCGYSASLAWHGSWLLYSNGRPDAAVVDATGRTAALGLRGTISRLPGVSRDGIFTIAWVPAP